MYDLRCRVIGLATDFMRPYSRCVIDKITRAIYMTDAAFATSVTESNAVCSNSVRETFSNKESRHIQGTGHKNRSVPSETNTYGYVNSLVATVVCSFISREKVAYAPRNSHDGLLDAHHFRYRLVLHASQC